MSFSSAATSIVQFQLSFRNLKAVDVALPADPLAIVSCASGTPQGAARCWAELGRTECKANSTNPNFHHKIIVSLPRQDSATEDELLRVDVYDLGKSAVAGFDPLACSPSCYLGGVCFSARSIVQRLPSDAEAFTDPISLFFELIGSSSALSGSLPHTAVQAPQEFNVMLAATPTPFCILQCCPVASNQSSFASFESYNNVQIASKYPRTSYANSKKCSTSVLSTLDRRDALVMTQSIAAYAYDKRLLRRATIIRHCEIVYNMRRYSFSHMYPAFSKTHRASRLLLMNDWAALRVTMLELLQLAREQPAQFFAFSAHGQQPLSCMVNSCLYSLADRLKQTNTTAETIDTHDFPDVFTVIAALTEGMLSQARKLPDADAVAFRARYNADTLDLAVQREVQMLISRPHAATDSTYVTVSCGKRAEHA